jgi:hypothetical protein
MDRRWLLGYNVCGWESLLQRVITAGSEEDAMSAADDYKTGFDEGVRYAQGTSSYAEFVRYERFNADPNFDFETLELPENEYAILNEHLDRGDVVNIWSYKSGWMYGALSVWRNVSFGPHRLW